VFKRGSCSPAATSHLGCTRNSCSIYDIREIDAVQDSSRDLQPRCIMHGALTCLRTLARPHYLEANSQPCRPLLFHSGTTIQIPVLRHAAACLKLRSLVANDCRRACPCYTHDSVVVLVWLLGVVWSRLGRALCLSRRERAHMSKHGSRVAALSTRLRAGQCATFIFCF
jgi:hypothetical protein